MPITFHSILRSHFGVAKLLVFNWQSKNKFYSSISFKKFPLHFCKFGLVKVNRKMFVRYIVQYISSLLITFLTTVARVHPKASPFLWGSGECTVHRLHCTIQRARTLLYQLMLWALSSEPEATPTTHNSSLYAENIRLHRADTRVAANCTLGCFAKQLNVSLSPDQEVCVYV